MSRELRGELIVLNTETGRYFRLDEAGAALWRAIDDRGFEAGRDEPQIQDFLATAVEHGLLEEESGPHRASSLNVTASPPLLATAAGLSVNGSFEELREDFRRQHFVRLPGLLEPGLLDAVVRSIEQGEFVKRTHGGIGTEACLSQGVATSALQLIFNDPQLLAAVAAIAECGPLGCFDGRVYRMIPGAGHYDSWHSDVGEDRLVGLSVNLSPAGYEGGALEMRYTNGTKQEYVGAGFSRPKEPATWTVENGSFGSAILFRISPALRHRVSPVTGTTPRTAYAGWFRSAPDFQDLFFASLP